MTNRIIQFPPVQTQVTSNERTIKDLFNFAQQDANNKVDLTVSPDQLRVKPDGRIYTKAQLSDPLSNGYALTDWSMTQMCNRLHIPTRYYKLCPPDLRAVNANYWLTNLDEQSDWLLRLRTNNNNGLVRGIMSEKYSPFDDHEILEILSKILDKKEDGYKIQMFNSNDTGFHLRITFEDLTTTIGKTIDGTPDVHKVGLHIRNSEVGKSAVKIQPMVWRLVCTNGLMGWRGEELMSIRHIHLKSNEMYSRVATGIVNGLKMGNEMIDKITAAKEVEIPDPFKAIEDLTKDLKYSQDTTDQIKSSFMMDPHNSVFGVVQALTRASQKYESDRRVEIEEDAGNYLRKMVTA